MSPSQRLQTKLIEHLRTSASVRNSVSNVVIFPIIFLSSVSDSLIFSSQGFLPETFFHRLLTEHSEIPKKSRRRHHHHHHHHHTPEPTAEDPSLEGVEEETLVSDGAYMMDEDDLDTSHHFLTSPDFDIKMEGGDSLSQGDYDSSDQEALLGDVIMAQKDSDSSSSSED